MKFTPMREPLKYDVRRGRKIEIPAGATGVEIAFRQSPFKYFNEEKNRFIPLNVYRYQGRLIHA